MMAILQVTVVKPKRKTSLYFQFYPICRDRTDLDPELIARQICDYTVSLDPDVDKTEG